MSTEAAIAALERMKIDRHFRDDVAAAPNSEARYALLNEAGFEVTPADKDVFVDGMDREPIELGDEQLEEASGAGDSWDLGPLGPRYIDPALGW